MTRQQANARQLAGRKPRQASLQRETAETNVSVTLNLDGEGIYDVSTGNGFLDHMVNQLARHGLFDISLHAQGDLETGWHHLVEDVGIMLGRAFHQALGEARGIRRMGHALVPLDESLALVAVDCSGRPYAEVETTLDGTMVETLPGDTSWIDTGTHESLLRASREIQAFEKSAGALVGSIEEAAFRMGFIDRARLQELAGELKDSDYGRLLLELAGQG